MSEFVLVPSPLLGPTTWEPVARELRARDLPVAVVSYDRAPSTPRLVLDAIRRTAGGLDDVVLVPHSNAGLHAPRLAAELDLAATVFVDAALPSAGPGATDTPLAPPGLLDLLAGLADGDGLLPPWTQWWPSLDGLFPSPQVARQVAAEQHRLPLSYFRQRVTVPTGWAGRPCAYLAFGATYADEQVYAVACGWPHRVLDGRHLHQLHDPAGVAAAIVALAAEALRG